MPLSQTFFFSPDPVSLTIELDKMYRDIATEINGTFKRSTTPTISGGTSTGVGTYGQREALYLRQGIIVDYWFYISWTAHTGTGLFIVDLPFEAYTQTIVPAVGFCITSNIPFPAGITSVNILADAGSRNAFLIGHGNGVAAQPINLSGSGTIQGYIRYIAKDDR